MYHIFICSSVNGHLSCLHVLAIVNSAAMNIGAHVSFWIIDLSRYMPRSRASLVTQIVKNLSAMQETWVWSTGWEDPLEKRMTTVVLPGELHGPRSRVGYNPWGHKESDTTGWLWERERGLGVGLLDHTVILLLAFWGTSILFSTGAAPTYIPTNSVGVFPFPHTLSSICGLFDDGWPDCYVLIPSYHTKDTNIIQCWLIARFLSALLR